jgi:hypothetical protein
MVNYAMADVWKKRAEAAIKVDKLAKLSVKAVLAATKAGGIPQLVARARLDREAVAQSAKAAEKVWADTADTLKTE